MSYSRKISTFSRSFAAGISGLVSFGAPAHASTTPSSSELINRAWQGVGASIRNSMDDYDRQHPKNTKRES